MDIKFDLGQPFKPFEQLMGVFPAARSVITALSLRKRLTCFYQSQTRSRHFPTANDERGVSNYRFLPIYF